MPPKKKKSGGRKRRRKVANPVMGMNQAGTGFFSDLWDGVKDVGRAVYKPVLRAGGELLKSSGDPRLRLGGQIASQLGSGKQKHAAALPMSMATRL